ncbi:MAG: hypothetical protein OHK0023_27500 [Anaerolineae bacterium]
MGWVMDESGERIVYIPLEKSAYAFSFRVQEQVIEGVVYSFSNTDWRVITSDGYQSSRHFTRAAALLTLSKHYKLGKYAESKQE